MPSPKIGLPREVLAALDPTDVTSGLARIRAELQVPGDFPADVLTAAEAAAADPQPDHVAATLGDLVLG